MLKTLKTMDSTYRANRILTLACVAAVVITAVFSVFYVTRAVREQSQTVYALMGDNAVRLRAVSILENRPAEAHNHVELFHRLFFDLDPDRAVIDANVNRALSLADNSVQVLYEEYAEEGFYRNLISSNTSQDIQADNVDLDMSTYPYHFRFEGKVTITRRTSIVTRSLVTEGYFRDVQRSVNNPHGFLIERYGVLDNQDLTVKARY